MKRLKKESFKTALLISLILLSVAQIGIHWHLQGQRFPFDFISQIFNINQSSAININSIKGEYFIPESIIVTQSSHIKLEHTDSNFKSIWADFEKNYLPEIIKNKPYKIVTKNANQSSDDFWKSTIGKRFVKIDFSINWPKEIIQWLENINPKDKNFDLIRSVAILPENDPNESVNTVLVYDENQVYHYKINMNSRFLPKNYYKTLAEKLSLQDKPKMASLTDAFNTFTQPQNSDILVSLDNKWNSSFSSIKIEIPSKLSLNAQNLNNIQNAILLNQRESLMPYYDKDKGEASFTDTENLYKYYSNGLLQYKYLRESSKDTVVLSLAFSQILSFIELRRGLIGDIDLLISKIEKKDNCFEFHFDYSYNGVPIYFGGVTVKDRITSPIMIKANSERVLECSWAIRSISEIGESKKYNLYFPNLIENQIKTYYPEIISTKKINGKIFFSRIEPGYIFFLDDMGITELKPNWIISQEDKDYYIPLLAEGE